MLLKKGADPNATDRNHRTVLHWATWAEQPEIMLLLLKSGANSDTQNRRDETPLAAAVEKGFEVGIEILLAHGAEMNYLYNLFQCRRLKRFSHEPVGTPEYVLLNGYKRGTPG